MPASVLDMRMSRGLGLLNVEGSHARLVASTHEAPKVCALTRLMISSRGGRPFQGSTTARCPGVGVTTFWVGADLSVASVPSTCLARMGAGKGGSVNIPRHLPSMP